MKFILGKKLEMTQVWRNDEVVAVTKVQAGPCTVTQVKIPDKDGYEAVQVGYGEKKEKNIAKPQIKHMKKAGGSFRYLREFRLKEIAADKNTNSHKLDLKIGDKIDVGTFAIGDKVQVTGVSKGKGFQGVVRRHGFHGQDKTHGTKDQLRMPGSIGATGPAHVFKGTRMPGRMGGDQIAVNNLEIIEVDKENNILLIKGAVPGARNGLVLICGEGELKTAVVETGDEATIDDKEEENKKARKPSSAEVSSSAKATADKTAGKQENKSAEKQEEKIIEKKKDEEPKKEEKTVDKKPSSAKAMAGKEETPEDVEREVVEAKEKVDAKPESKSEK